MVLSHRVWEILAERLTNFGENQMIRRTFGKILNIFFAFAHLFHFLTKSLQNIQKVILYIQLKILVSRCWITPENLYTFEYFLKAPFYQLVTIFSSMKRRVYEYLFIQINTNALTKFMGGIHIVLCKIDKLS